MGNILRLSLEIFSQFEDKNKMLKIPLRPFRGCCIFPSPSCTEGKPLTCDIINIFPERTGWDEFVINYFSNSNYFCPLKQDILMSFSSFFYTAFLG